MDSEMARARVLDAAEELFYGRGVQAVGMDEIRSASGVSLKRVYQLFPAKTDLVEAYLLRRDARWRADLARFVADGDSSRERILRVYDWLERWFGEPDFRGCAFVNSYGEMGAVSEAVARAARTHKELFQRYVAGLVADAGQPDRLAAPLALLAEGAITTAAISGSPEPARHAREAAARLLEA
ncbi:TetR/AcrR family transcriptional regulator [Streptantibioticus ferralitis]|uniref:TetR/AcrR family transcriptional regulator n=1 Tax=Streptantibioticus ferralitis TaxID=236510 RepID=A0ABT5ZAF1_9ACTN|nr:TetR/AcrR family transcriptional regulator [Streptantibioticus ferralitis]MDF2260812.1 TetR/AcrR family transcriptional regulator [Streptantibioticus ferralitis]